MGRKKYDGVYERDGIYWVYHNGARATPNTPARAWELYHEMVDAAKIATAPANIDAEVIILRGVPGCGKTTWARAWIEEHQTYKRISRDMLRQMFDFGAYDALNERFIKEMRAALIQSCLRDGWSVVIDDTNCKERDVIAIRNAAHVRDRLISVSIKTFDTSLEECIRRDALREKPVGERRIIEMWEQLNGRIMTPEFWQKMCDAVSRV